MPIKLTEIIKFLPNLLNSLTSTLFCINSSITFLTKIGLDAERISIIIENNIMITNAFICGMAIS